MSAQSTPAAASPTAELACFAAELELDQLPPGARVRLAQCLLDFVGVAAGGRVHAESSQALRAGVLASAPSTGPASVIGEVRGFTPRDAALLNGAFAHTLDFDDTNLASLIHPGAVVIPAALAAAEQLDAGGDDLLAAVAAGYEVCCRVGLALGQGAYARGFHPTAVAGVFGATAAVARLQRLGAEETAAAFGLAGSMASGSMQYLDSGSWNKRLHPGLAAHNGLLAVDLAAAGVIGARDSLEGRLGFLHAYSESADATALSDGLGARWLLAETGIKPYPACRLAHGAIDAALAVRERLDGAPTAGADVQLRISPGAAPIVGGDGANKRSPQNTVDAQFSVYFQTAVALLDGEVMWWSYNRLRDRDVVALMERIDLVVDPDVSIAGAVLRCASGGTTVEVRVEQPLGEPDRDLAWESVEAKYRALAAPLLPDTAVAGVAAWARALPDAGPVRGLTALLRASDP